jgi:beta-fructofuranosidase
MYYTALSSDPGHGVKDQRIGLAESCDLTTWELQPPLTEPAGFGQLEVPQLRVVDGRHVLVFT